MKKYLGILLLGLLLISGTTVFAQTSGSGIFAVEVVGSPTTWTQGTNKNVTWQSAGVGTKFDVLVCYLRAAQSDACFFAYQNLTNTGSAVSVRVGTNVPLNSMAYVKVRKAGTDTVMAKSGQFKVVAPQKLTVSLASDSPEQAIIIVDDVSNTDNVTLLKGRLSVTPGDSVVVNKLPVTLTTVGGANLTSVVSSVMLVVDGEEIDSKTVSNLTTSGVITFDGLDTRLPANTATTSVNFAVIADINDIEAGSFDEGDTLKAELTDINRAAIDIRNSQNVLFASANRSGNALGKIQEFRTEGIQVTFVSATTDATTGTSVNDDIGLFTIKFRVKAVGDAVYLSSLPTSIGYIYTVEKSGVATSARSITATIVNDTDDDLTSVGNYKIEEDEEETIIMSVSVPLGTGGTSGQYRMLLKGIKWDTDDDATPDYTHTSGLENFKTMYRILNLENTNQLASVLVTLEQIMENVKAMLQGR